MTHHWGLVFVLEFQAEGRVGTLGVHFVAPDIAFFLQDAGDVSLDLGIGGQHFRKLGRARVADAGQEVGDGVGQCAHVS